MNPSGKLTFSESGHQLENDLLQGVVQPGNRERGEREEGGAGRERRGGGEEGEYKERGSKGKSSRNKKMLEKGRI